MSHRQISTGSLYRLPITVVHSLKLAAAPEPGLDAIPMLGGGGGGLVP